jgi:hypothetical protein
MQDDAPATRKKHAEIDRPYCEICENFEVCALPARLRLQLAACCALLAMCYLRSQLIFFSR